MPRYLDDDELHILRRAKKQRLCRGDGAIPAVHAPDCPIRIAAGEQYVEYVGEVPLYATGTAHSLQCIRATQPELLSDV